MQINLSRALHDVLRLPLEGLYERRLLRKLKPLPKPRHVGVILDGNRRWAAEQGGPASRGHRIGASRIAQLLTWCDEQEVEVVTLWLLSTENLSRNPSELIPLLRIIERTAEELAATGNWRINLVGASGELPESTTKALEAAVAKTAGIDALTVNMAVGYSGRRELVDAVTAYLSTASKNGKDLEDCIEEISAKDIEDHLYTKGQPDPDLLIRTSGEQRLSGFLLWQSAHSEFWFTDAYWPDFRKIDFLRALRDFGNRKRRFGG
jgi:short-chain Z-isoprenyl diphosphate synthase